MPVCCRNEYTRLDDGSVALLIDNKNTVLFDASDLELVQGYQWSVGTHGYATAGSGTDQVLMHRLLMTQDKMRVVDHINRNKLDNRRSNLRVCNQSENGYNKAAQRNCQSGYRGVAPLADGRWHAQITYKGKAIFLGKYRTPEEAANAYDSAAAILVGEFAHRNLPDVPLRADVFDELASCRRKGWLSEDEVQRIKNLRCMGYPYKRIAAITDRSVDSVRRVLNGTLSRKPGKYRGRPRADPPEKKHHPRWLTMEQINEIADLHREGKTVREIATITGRGKETIRRRIIKGFDERTTR